MQRELAYDLRIKNTLKLPPTKNDIFQHKLTSIPGNILWNAMPDTITSVEKVRGELKNPRR